MTNGDINLDLPYNESASTEDVATLALEEVFQLKEAVRNLLTRVEAIENHIINNSIPQYKPPGAEKHLPLGEVLTDLYNRTEK